MKKIDKYIGKALFSKFGDKVERRDYYELEKKEEYLKGKGKTNGLMYLVDVDYDHYIDINIFKSGLVKMSFRIDDLELISISQNKNIEKYLKAFLSLIDEEQSFNYRCNQISNGDIPKDLIRGEKINNVLND